MIIYKVAVTVSEAETVNQTSVFQLLSSNFCLPTSDKNQSTNQQINK